MHKHHILPRHVLEWNDPVNLVEVTVDEHAECHRYLWETFNYYEDYVAWQGLSGMIDRKDIISAAIKMSPRMQGKRHSEHTKQKLRSYRHTNEAKQKIQQARMSNPSPGMTGKKHSQETLQKMKKSAAGRTPHPKGEKWRLIICPHCHKEGGVNVMKRWHFENCKEAA